VAQRLEVVLNQPLELGAAADLRDAARYAMVALADEVFAHLDWPDRDAWRDAPLEVRLFESDVAGEVLFQKIDALLVLPSGEHALLGQIYLLTLSLGFRGKLRGARHDATIDRYRRALYAHALCHPPHVVLSTEGADAGPQLSPAAYAQTIDDELPRRLPTIARWGWVTVGLVGAYLVISHLLWRDAIDPLLQRLGGLG
jgi:type VI secretion system protein ImpK